jgi:hypothetical protein
VPADVLKVVIRWFVEEVLNTGNLEALFQHGQPRSGGWRLRVEDGTEATTDSSGSLASD